VPHVVGLHHVQLAMPADGEGQARRFYGGLLGLTEVPKPPHLVPRGGCWFRGNGVELHLGVEQPFNPARKAHPALLVDDLAGLRTRLVDAGVPAADDTQLEGFTRFYAEDPFGNRLEFLQVNKHD
jgi:catechol 2,3-dioxygenase-like lactoylglutathione lyase family enzyme